MYATEYELGTPIPDRACGNCTLCCKVNGVPELEKPVDEWCKHCAWEGLQNLRGSPGGLRQMVLRLADVAVSQRRLVSGQCKDGGQCDPKREPPSNGLLR